MGYICLTAGELPMMRVTSTAANPSPATVKLTLMEYRAKGGDIYAE